MLNGKVFIAWSNADTGRKLAYEVRNELGSYKYEGIVGGESLNGTVSIGDKIFSEIDKCHYAIIIVAAKGDKTFSNNLSLEWGYCHHKFQGKEEAFLVNGFTLEDSDLRGMNANPLKDIIDFSCPEDITKAAKEIVDLFLEKQNRIGSEENKVIKTLDDWAGVVDNINNGSLTDVEMAKQILFYSQSAYIFHRIDDSHMVIRNYLASNPAFEPELAANYALTTLNMFKNIASTSNKGKKLPIGIMSECEDEFLSIHSKVDQIDNEELRDWFLVNVYKNLNYMYTIQAQDKTLEESDRKEYKAKAFECGEDCIKICDKLKENVENETYALFCQAYMYRNLYKLSWQCNDNDLAKEYAEKAVDAKRKVRENIKNRRFSNDLIEFFEGEYYLSLSEYLKFCTSEAKVNAYIEQLNDYCTRVETSFDRRLSSMKIIQKTIKRMKTKLYIFDFDLTIADSVEASKDGYKKAFKFIGCEKSYREEDVIKFLSEHLEDTYDRLDKADKSYEEFQQCFIKAVEKSKAKITLYDDVKTVVEKLHEKGKKIAIVSNRDRATIEKVLRAAKVDDKIDYICASDDMPSKRKNADSIEKCINEYDFDKEEVLYLGDSNEDKTIAGNAGVAFLRVDRNDLYDEKKMTTLNDLEY